MKVKDLMSKNVRVCQLEETLSTAASAMWEADCGALPVIGKNGVVMGMITDRDICMATFTQGRPPQTIAVKSAMSKELVSCGAEDTLVQAQALMREHQIRRLPVASEKGELLGILSLNDIARHFEQQGKRKDVRAADVASTLAAIGAPRAIEKGQVAA